MRLYNILNAWLRYFKSVKASLYLHRKIEVLVVLIKGCKSLTPQPFIIISAYTGTDRLRFSTITDTLSCAFMNLKITMARVLTTILSLLLLYERFDVLKPDVIKRNIIFNFVDTPRNFIMR